VLQPYSLHGLFSFSYLTSQLVPTDSTPILLDFWVLIMNYSRQQSNKNIKEQLEGLMLFMIRHEHITRGSLHIYIYEITNFYGYMISYQNNEYTIA
jgi:hypothetical protein